MDTQNTEISCKDEREFTHTAHRSRNWQHENQSVEYKLKWNDEFLKEICAFANAQGGTLYVGIDDNGKIQMRIFEDHIELWNEGNLPENYTIETLLHKHASKPRNLNIADIFNKAGFIEAWGRGYKKIQDGFKAANLPMPVFKTVFGGVEVIIQRPKFKDDDGINGGVNGGINGGINKIQLSKRQHDLLILIKGGGGINGGINGGLTKEELAKMLGVGLRTIEREMSLLKELDLVEHIGSNKTGYWRVKQNNTIE